MPIGKNEMITKYGVLPLIDEIPYYDDRYQYLEVKGFTISPDKTTVTKEYAVVDIVELGPTNEEKAAQLVAKKTSEKMMKNKELTTMEIDTAQHLLDTYIREGQKYYVGDVFRWNNWPYEVIKNHQSVYELEPHHRDAEQYYKKIMPKGSIPV